MKGTADFHAKVAFSLLQAAPATANGVGIDCSGFDEALPFIGHGALGGSGGGPFSSALLWSESSDNVNFTAITNAVHSQCLVSLAVVVASVNLTNALVATIAAQPAKPSRLVVTVVDTTPSIVAGTVIIVGTRPPRDGERPGPARTDAGVAFTDGGSMSQAVTEIISIAAGAGTYKTTAIFDSVTAVYVGNATGAPTGAVAVTVLGGSGDETIKVGVDNTGTQVPHEGRINLVNRKRYIRAENTAAGSSPTGAVCAGLVLMRPRRRGLTGFVHTVPIEFNIT